MSNERLAGIEARTNGLMDLTRPLIDGQGAHTEYQYLVQDVCDDDIPWLLSRVRALQAQAALDGAVVEAIGPYREADDAVTRAYNRYVASKGTVGENVADFDLNWTRGVFIGCERVLDDALDAALAARETGAE
jgi:hypothetical protein